MESPTAIQKLYSNPKSKGFVNHLISSYLPVDKAQKIWQFEKKGPHKCNVCSHELIDISTVMERMQNSGEFMEDTIDHMKKSINGELVEGEEHPMKKHISKGAILAWTGKGTDTNLCLGCIQDLLDMVQTGMLMGDKNLTWKINSMRRDHVFNTFTENPALDKEEKKKVKTIRNRVEKSPIKKATLGDFQELQKLKEKMDAAERK